VVLLKRFSPSDKDLLWRYSLVLLAAGIPHEIRKEKNSWEIWVEAADLERALREIEAYERENSGFRSKEPALQEGAGEKTFWSFFILTAVLSFTFEPRWQDLLFRWGILDGALVRKGEWWRVLTSLFLHQDPGHLLGNMLFGGVFFAFLTRYLPFWKAWGLTILSGVSGNVLSLLLHPENYRALGFSTAVFGEVGLLAALGLSERRHQLLLIMGFVLAFLGFLGTAGENTDLLAHLCGAVSGVFWGLAYRRFRKFSQKF